MDMKEFEDLVAEALDSLPEEFLEQMENWQVSAEEWPSVHDLRDLGIPTNNRRSILGLYRGVPATERTSRYMNLPDCIIIYKGPIEAYVGQNKEAIRKQVRRTIIHEIGHYWGLSERRLRELGWA